MLDGNVRVTESTGHATPVEGMSDPLLPSTRSLRVQLALWTRLGRDLVLAPLALIAICAVSFRGFHTLGEVSRTQQFQRLGDFRDVTAVFESRFGSAQAAALRFVKTLQSKELGQMIVDLENKNVDSYAVDLLYPPRRELKDYCQAMDFFELLGLSVKHGYVEFDLIYDRVAFPDDFWQSTDRLRKALAGHWSREKASLADYGEGVEYLKMRYDQQRKLHASALPPPHKQPTAQAPRR